MSGIHMQVFFMIPLKIATVSTCTYFWIKTTQIIPPHWKKHANCFLQKRILNIATTIIWYKIGLTSHKNHKLFQQRVRIG